MATRPAARGHWATVLSPLTASPARGRVPSTFSSRRASRPLFFRHGFAGANRRRPGSRFLEAIVFSGRLAQLCLQHAVPSRLAPRPTSAVLSVGHGGPAAPVPLRGSAYPKTACARGGGGSHRLADPVASRRALITVTRCRASLVHAARCSCDARCCTQRRPPAGSTRSKRLVPSGTAFRKRLFEGEGYPPAPLRGHW
jgi:hypothetical protein